MVSSTVRYNNHKRYQNQRYPSNSTDRQLRPYGMRFYARHRTPRLYSDQAQNRMGFWGFNSPPAPKKPKKVTVWSVLQRIISSIRTILNPVSKFLQAKFPEQFAGGGFCSPGCCCGAVAATATVIIASVGLGVGLGVGLTSGDPPFNLTLYNNQRDNGSLIFNSSSVFIGVNGSTGR